MPYQIVFFDLDHTLWDYETNCENALRHLHQVYNLPARGVTSFDAFHKAFVSINNQLWNQFDRGEIQHEEIRYERFHRILMEVGVDDRDMSLLMSQQYVAESPKGPHLMPGAKEILAYLSATYPLVIITNGFAEIQSVKLASSGIDHYFKKVITSQQAGHKKPDKQIFDYALSQTGVPRHEAIMIGDNLVTDIAGARNAGIDQVYYNPNRIQHGEQVTFEICELSELKRLL